MLLLLVVVAVAVAAAAVFLGSASAGVVVVVCLCFFRAMASGISSNDMYLSRFLIPEGENYIEQMRVTRFRVRDCAKICFWHLRLLRRGDSTGVLPPPPMFPS